MGLGIIGNILNLKIKMMKKSAPIATQTRLKEMEDIEIIRKGINV